MRFDIFAMGANSALLFQARAKHDTTNTVVAGCVTGGALSAKGNLFPGLLTLCLC